MPRNLLLLLVQVGLGLACSSELEPVGGREFLSDAELEQRILTWSEKPGYFDTDNLVSNEDSYQHVVPGLLEWGQAGRAYLGVGPDQNYTYIAHLEPVVAVIVDVRRKNLLQHLFFKELFHRSETRVDFLAALLGRPAAGLTGGDGWTARQLVRRFREQPSDPEFFARCFAAVWESMSERFPRLIRPEDRGVVLRMAQNFFVRHLELKFNSHGRPPRAIYPTFAELLMETDRQGTERSYLASEKSYRFVRDMHRENRIIPVVGDLGGTRALARIGKYLADQRFLLSAFYLSNVEFYLLRRGQFEEFVNNLRCLPSDSRSLLIRSYFGNWGTPHPERVPGYAVTSLLQKVPRFLQLEAETPHRNYEMVVFRDYLSMPGSASRWRLAVPPSSGKGGGLIHSR